MPPLDLAQLFPPVPQGTQHIHRNHFVEGSIATDASKRDKVGRRRREGVSTRWAAVYALELRGLNYSEIATALGLNPQTIYKIVNDDRYLAYREEHLTALDADFVMMKPLAFSALKSGLNSVDENTALRASEQWFKAAGFGGFSKEPQHNPGVTAEDVAAQLIAGATVNVAVQVNVGGEREE